MGSFLPGLLWGVLAPVVIVLAGMWLLRRWRSSTFGERDDYTGAMGSAAMEAMMAEARRQRAALQERGDAESGEESGREG